jgi:hypothetical protein
MQNYNEGFPTNLKYDGGELRIEDSIVAATKDFAIVELECLVGDVSLRSRGSSRRFLGDKDTPADKPNKNVGIGLAFSRALASMAKKIERQALGQSTHVIGAL